MGIVSKLRGIIMIKHAVLLLLLAAAVHAEDTCYTYQLNGWAMNWWNARSYCQGLGGDLAFHGFDDLDYRQEVLCNQLNFCYPNSVSNIWWGIEKVSGTTDQWQYVDGTPASNSDIHWSNAGEASQSGDDCSMWYVWETGSDGNCS